MLRFFKFFTLIHSVFGIAMPKMQQVTLSEQDLSHRQLYFNPYRDTLQQMPHVVQYKKILDQLQQLALNELMLTFLHNKWEHPTEAQPFLHKQPEQELWRKITETDHHQDPQIEQHYIPHDQNNKSVDKRHQPIDTNGFDQSDNLKMDNDSKKRKRFLHEKLRPFLQDLQAQNDEKGRKLQKIIEKIRDVLHGKNQTEQQKPIPQMIEIQDMVPQQKEEHQLMENEIMPKFNPLEMENHHSMKNSFNQPQEENIKYYHFAENPHSHQPQENLFMGMQNSKIMGNEYQSGTGEQNIQNPGDNALRQQPEFGELHYVVKQLHKNLQNQNAWQSQMSPSELQAKLLQEQMEKQMALGYVQADIEKRLRASHQNEGTQPNQGEPFHPQTMMTPDPSQLNPDTNFNVMDIMKRKDVTQNALLQSSTPFSMLMGNANANSNANLWGNMNTNGPPTMMMMPMVENTQQKTMMPDSNPLIPQMNNNEMDITKSQNMPLNSMPQYTLYQQMANPQGQYRGYSNNIGSSMAMTMQMADNGPPQSQDFMVSPSLPLTLTNDPAYSINNGPAMGQDGSNTQQQNNLDGSAAFPMMSNNMPDPNCPNPGGCMSMISNNDKTESENMGEIGKLIPRAWLNLTPVSIIIAIIQNFLALEFYESIKLDRVAIEESERHIFFISSNLNVLSAFTDHLLFLRRRLEYFPVQYGAHYRILTQIREKIARMASLRYETTRALNHIKVDLHSRRKEALTSQTQQLTNGLINIILFIINVIPFFSADESLTGNALLFQVVVTAVFGGILIANVTFYFFLGGFLTSFDGILESVSEFELQLESLSAHFHDTLDRVDFAFETPRVYANQGMATSISLSNSAPITTSLNFGGFSLGGFGGLAGRSGLPADSSFDEQTDFSPNQPLDSSFHERTSISRNQPADSSFNEPAWLYRNEPVSFSPDRESSFLEMNPVPKTTHSLPSFNRSLTINDSPGKSDLPPFTVTSKNGKIKKPNTENSTLSDTFSFLKNIGNTLKSKIKFLNHKT